MPEEVKIVIVGNGFGGTYALKNLHNLLHKNKKRKTTKISLIGEKNYFLFTPMLHEVATGSINGENIVEPIRKVLGHCISEFYLGKAEDISLVDKTVRVGENTLSYDYLILAPGAETNFFNTKGAEDNTFTLKSIEDAIKIKNQVINQIELASHITDRGRRKKMLTFTIIGGGPTGVELAAELQELIQESFSRFYNKELIEDSSILIIQKRGEVLPQFNKKIRTKSLEFLKGKNIQIILNTKVEEVGSDYILTVSDDGEKKINTETIIWTAGIKPSPLTFDKEIEKAKDGRIIVNKYLQLEDHKNVFAIGDASAFKVEGTETFLPALAQVAHKEAIAVAKNISLLIKGKEPEPFIYKSKGSLVSLGQWMAIGEISNFTFWGHMTWWLWRTVYLSKLISFRKKMKVAMDWTVNLFSPRDISEL